MLTGKEKFAQNILYDTFIFNYKNEPPTLIKVANVKEILNKILR